MKDDYIALASVIMAFLGICYAIYLNSMVNKGIKKINSEITVKITSYGDVANVILNAGYANASAQLTEDFLSYKKELLESIQDFSAFDEVCMNEKIATSNPVTTEFDVEFPVADEELITVYK